MLRTSTRLRSLEGKWLSIQVRSRLKAVLFVRVDALGLVESMNNNELAAILAHEVAHEVAHVVAHVVARHTVKLLRLSLFS